MSLPCVMTPDDPITVLFILDQKWSLLNMSPTNDSHKLVLLPGLIHTQRERDTHIHVFGFFFFLTHGISVSEEFK